MNEKQKREMLTKAVSALLAASLVPTVSAAEIANALAPVAIVQETEVQQTEQELNLAVYAQASLQAQIDAAGAGQVTPLTLQGETSEDLTIPAGKIIVLNLNGHTLTNKTGHTITNYGTLTITGSGTVDNVSHERAAVYNQVGGVVTLDGGAYTRSKENGKSKEDSGNNSYYNIVNWGDMTINDGVEVTQNGNFSSMIENGFYNGNGKTNNPKLTINGGTFSGGLNTVKNDDRGVLEIKGGTFTNVSQAAVLNWNNATIDGGTFQANTDAQAVILNGQIDDAMDVGKLTINGGSFTAAKSSAVIKEMTGSGAKAIGTVEINDGTFATDNGEIISLVAANADKAKINIAKGRFTTTNESSKTALAKYVDPSAEFDATTGTVSAIPVEQAVVSVGAKNYKSLADAVAAVQDNDTITLLKDVTLTADLSIENGKTFTIDLNHKTLSGADIFIKGSAFVTAKNGKICGDVWLKTTNEDKPYNSFTLADDAEIETNGYGIVVTQVNKGAENYGSTVNIQGSVTGKESTLWVLGNITTDLKTAKNPVTVNVGSTAKLINNDKTNTALQMAGACVVTVEDGAQITGGTAIEVRAGKLTVKGGTITGTGTATEVQPNGNGTSTKGAGIGIAQHTTKQPIEVTISGGKISGHTAFFESNPQKNEGDAQQKIELNIAGGEFTATNGGTNAVSSESGKTNFVTGGTFSSPVNKDYLNGLNAELNTGKGDTPYSYYTDVDAAKDAAKKLGGGTVTDLNAASTTKFTVTLKFEDGATAGQTLTVAENGTLVLPTPTREGRWVFVHWTDGTKTYAAGAEYTVTADATLTAVWESTERTITLKYDDGATQDSAITAAVNDVITLPTPTRSGRYTFQHWTDGTNNYAGGSNYTVTENKTLTAVWHYTSSGSSTVTPGALITISRPQHGSATSSAGSSAIPGSNVMLTVTPDRGYELGSLSVRDSRGSELLLTNLGGGKYSFTMPAGSVQVDASFRKVTSASFVDVLPGSYYYDAVRWAVSNGITSGTSGITFSPNAACTRAQIVTFLWRAAGSPKPASNVNSFADVPADAYYRDAVLWAVEQGITNGVSEGRFDPNATVTRGQTVAFLYRATGRPSVSGSSVFHDVDAGAYYEDAVTWAYQKDITGGTSSSQFSPDAACTRAQIVTFLYRAQ